MVLLERNNVVIVPTNLSMALEWGRHIHTVLTRENGLKYQRKRGRESRWRE